MAAPYRSTPVFDETSLPAALRRDHSTKAGVWGVIRVIEGSLSLSYADPPFEQTLSEGASALCLPQQVHSVLPLGAMKMQVDFYDCDPAST
jgi:hemoglobin